MVIGSQKLSGGGSPDSWLRASTSFGPTAPGSTACANEPRSPARVNHRRCPWVVVDLVDQRDSRWARCGRSDGSASCGRASRASTSWRPWCSAAGRSASASSLASVGGSGEQELQRRRAGAPVRTASSGGSRGGRTSTSRFERRRLRSKQLNTAPGCWRRVTRRRGCSAVGPGNAPCTARSRPISPDRTGRGEIKPALRGLACLSAAVVVVVGVHTAAVVLADSTSLVRGAACRRAAARVARVDRAVCSALRHDAPPWPMRPR
jgi:hypothetical protein